jgi:hypothetical protein
MKSLLTLLAVIALIVAVPGCDVGGGRGPTQEQLAEAQEIEQEFAPLRREVQEFIRQNEGRTADPIIVTVQVLQGALETAEANVRALQSAPRDNWAAYKSEAESAVQALREVWTDAQAES